MARPAPPHRPDDAEKRDLIGLIQAGKALPEKYRFIQTSPQFELFDARGRQTKG